MRKPCSSCFRSWACRPTPARTCSTSRRCWTPARRRWARCSRPTRHLPVVSRGRRAAAGRRPALQLRRGAVARADPGRRAQDLPAQLPRVLRAAPVHAGRLLRPRRRSARCGSEVPFGTRLLFQADEQPLLAFAVEICEDLWTPIPPSSFAALAGATVLVNLSASNVTVGKDDYRAAAGGQPVGALHRRLPVLRRRLRRIDHRPGLGRPRPDLRERLAGSPRPSASPTAPS